jgi:hypothetical protein
MFKKIAYEDLNARQQENYNFHKISAVLADYGFTTLRLSDDWQGADFIAQHIDGEQFLKVQLKGRLTFCKKYRDKNLYIGFHMDDQWYLYPHDELFMEIARKSNIEKTESWLIQGEYHFPTLSVENRTLLEKFAL